MKTQKSTCHLGNIWFITRNKWLTYVTSHLIANSMKTGLGFFFFLYVLLTASSCAPQTGPSTERRSRKTRWHPGQVVYCIALQQAWGPGLQTRSCNDHLFHVHGKKTSWQPITRTSVTTSSSSWSSLKRTEYIPMRHYCQEVTMVVSS